MNNSKKIELIMWSIFLIAVILSIILTYLLLYQLIPSNLGPLYILFGTVIVTILGIHLNRKLEEEKQEKKIRRIISMINANMKVNIIHAEEYVSILKDTKIKENNDFKPLNVNFWELLRTNIVDVDLQNDLVLNLIDLKELIHEINDNISKRKEFINSFGREVYNEKTLPKLVNLNKKLKTKLEEFIKKSNLYLESYEYLISP